MVKAEEVAKDVVTTWGLYPGGTDAYGLYPQVLSDVEKTRSVVGTVQCLIRYAQTRIDRLPVVGDYTILHAPVGGTEPHIKVNGDIPPQSVAIFIGSDLILRDSLNFTVAMGLLINAFTEQSQGGIMGLVTNTTDQVLGGLSWSVLTEMGAIDTAGQVFINILPDEDLLLYVSISTLSEDTLFTIWEDGAYVDSAATTVGNRNMKYTDKTPPFTVNHGGTYTPGIERFKSSILGVAGQGNNTGSITGGATSIPVLLAAGGNYTLEVLSNGASADYDIGLTLTELA